MNNASYTRIRVNRRRLLDSHRIGNTNRFTTVRYPKIFNIYLIQTTFCSNMGLIKYPRWEPLSGNIAFTQTTRAVLAKAFDLYLD